MTSEHRLSNRAETFQPYLECAHRLRAETFYRFAWRLLNAPRSFISQRVVEPLRAWSETQRRYWELQSLGDHTLKDIGYSRSDILALAIGVWDEDTPEQNRRHALSLVVDNSAVPDLSTNSIHWCNRTAA